MNHWVKGLAMLLGVQLIVLAIGYLGPDTGAGDEPTFLAMIDMGAVDRVSVTDGDGASVALRRVAQQWQLADGLPVDEEKLTTLLDKIGGLKTGWPVSRSKEAQQRFEVGEEKFQRRLELGVGDEVTELYFGTSPGYQQVHARGATESVYAVKLSNFELPTAEDDWLDTGLLRPSGDITQATFTAGASAAEVSARVARDGENWLVDDQPVDSAAVSAVWDKLAGLSVLGIAAPDQTTVSDRQLLLLTDAVGELRLEFTRTGENEDYVVQSSRFPDNYFRVAASTAEGIVDGITEAVAGGGGVAESASATPSEPTDIVENSGEDQAQ